MVSEQVDVMPEEALDVLIITECPCDQQVATGFSCITYSNEGRLAPSPLEGNTSQENTSGKGIATNLQQAQVLTYIEFLVADATKIHQTDEALFLRVQHSASYITITLLHVIMHTRDTTYALDPPSDIYH